MKINIKREGSNWSGKKFKVEMIEDMLEGLAWMKNHGYTPYSGYTKKNGNHVTSFHSYKTDVKYHMEFVK